MTYDEFKAEYIKTFKIFMSYNPDVVGSQVYAEKMGELYDMNPEWAEQIEDEIN